MKKICKYCGQVFETKSKKSISCNSPDCKKEHKRELDAKDRKVQCKTCGKYFIGKKGKKYCSDECRRKAQKEIKKCIDCGKEIISIKNKQLCDECEKIRRMKHEKKCQRCGQIYKTTDENSLFCSIKCYGENKRENDFKIKIKRCKEIIEKDNTQKVIGFKQGENRGKDTIEIQCLKCNDIEVVNARHVSEGKYKGCKKCYEKHCKKCGSIIIGYWKDDICTKCKTELKEKEKREKKRKELEEKIRKKLEENEIQRKQAIERINKEKSKLKKCTSCGKEFTNSLLEICNECNEILEKRLYGIRCECCGELFVPKHHNKKYCSERCARKASNKRKDILRDKRLKENGEIDNSITLEKLYKRDNGVCKICGGKCNYDDYRRDENGTFIAGSDYPSIDHIIPISKGGQHTWDNVQLAHMICNSIKNNKI